MALPYRERMEREISRLDTALAGLVHSYDRRGPGDVHVGMGEYVTGAELLHYQHLRGALAVALRELDEHVSDAADSRDPVEPGRANEPEAD